MENLSQALTEETFRCIVNEDDRLKVDMTLQQFEETFKKCKREHMLERQRNPMEPVIRIDLKTKRHLDNNGISINQAKRFGHVPSVAIGDQFLCRAELAVVGMHSRPMHGIDYMLHNGTNHATSVVNAGRYENITIGNDLIIFCGQGGCKDFGERTTDQEMEGGNLALMQNMKKKIAVRVIQKCKNVNLTGPNLMLAQGRSVYVYKGLYNVVKCQPVPVGRGHQVFKYDMIKIQGQSP